MALSRKRIRYDSDASKEYEQKRDLVDLLCYTLRKRRKLISQESESISEFDDIINIYESAYSKSSLPEYVTFDAEGDEGIPKLVRYFKHFEPQNTTEKLNCWLPKNNFRLATINNFNHVKRYLTADEFNINLLKCKTFDHVKNAIISYMLYWNDKSLMEFARYYPTFEKIPQNILLERQKDDGAYLYERQGVPILKVAIKIIKQHFDFIQTLHQSQSDILMTPMTIRFNLLSLIGHDFVTHIRNVYDWAVNDTFDTKKISLVESYMPIPYKLPNVTDIDSLRGISNFKFISGEACCGKTSLLATLKSKGWLIYSRGDVGSFGGKATNPPSVGNLHAALQAVLTRGNVIGGKFLFQIFYWTKKNKKT